MPDSKMRSYRSPDDIYKPAKERAQAEGTDLAKVINRFLERYGKGNPKVRKS